MPHWSLWSQAALVWIWSASLAATIIAVPPRHTRMAPAHPSAAFHEVNARATATGRTPDVIQQADGQRYLSGFRHHNREQILGCLTDDIRWTVFGAFQIQGKAAYAEHITEPGLTGRPTLHVVRMIEEGDTIMAELAGEARADDARFFAWRWQKCS